jgi:urease accessory protein UreF
MKITFLKTRKPKKFHYKARFFDEEKEKREMRRQEMGLGNQEKIKFESRMHSSWKYHRETERKRKKQAELQTLIYIAIIGLIIYLLIVR